MIRHPQTSIYDTGFAAHESVRQENIKLNERITRLKAKLADVCARAGYHDNETHTHDGQHFLRCRNCGLNADEQEAGK